MCKTLCQVLFKKSQNYRLLGVKKAIGAGLIAYHKVRNVQDQIVNHQNSLIEITTGSKKQQARRTFVYNTVTGFVDAAVTGAASGAMVGDGYGAAAGAIFKIVFFYKLPPSNLIIHNGLTNIFIKIHGKVCNFS